MRGRYPDRFLWAVFEPRTNTSRRRFFEDAYIEALSGADGVLLAGVYRPEEIPEDDRLRPERIVAELCARDVQAQYEPDADAIIERLAQSKKRPAVALIMSNGEFGGIWQPLLARLGRTERN